MKTATEALFSLYNDLAHSIGAYITAQRHLKLAYYNIVSNEPFCHHGLKNIKKDTLESLKNCFAAM